MDRSEPMDNREPVLGRWEVIRDQYDFDWLVYNADATYEEAFPTHAEAIAYADRMARTNQGENK
ncbi:hypothetical protein ABZ820_33345 [Streptomyces diacarni]|uniref:hypothetical protein n=1 Tax=Streptomyces diacarni TaxID=2800381 RepID=UPI0033C821A0